MSDIVPSGCRYCGIDQQNHLQRWDAQYRAETGNGWHQHIPPTADQVRTRMTARRASSPASTPKS